LISSLSSGGLEDPTRIRFATAELRVLQRT
jgi:hypothetical protein